MSKNITIQEGGVAKQLTVDKIKTNVVGGGTCLWVPEDETRLGSKHITENGTYTATSDGYYGYSQVTVNGIGIATGKDPTTGKESTVTTDPTTGELETTVIPTSIRITTPTSFVGPYSNGEVISFDGLVVHAYDSDGEDMGEVPFNDLIFPVTVAEYDGRGVVPYYDPQNDGYMEDNMYVYALDYIVWQQNTQKMKCPVQNGRPIPVYAWTANNGNLMKIFYDSGTGYDIPIAGSQYIHQITLLGSNVIWCGDYSGNPSPANVIADTANHRTKEEAIAARMDVPVQWQRPGDGAVLEAYFGISVLDIRPGTGDD